MVLGSDRTAVYENKDVLWYMLSVIYNEEMR